MSRMYKENLILLDIGRERSQNLCGVINEFPQFKVVVDYTKVGPRRLRLCVDNVPDDHTQWHRIPSPFIAVKYFFKLSQMDDYGNMCWVESCPYEWDGYAAYLVQDCDVKGLGYGMPYPYVLHAPTCH